MGQVVDFSQVRPRGERLSNARDAFPPIIAQETIDTEEAAQQRQSLWSFLGVSIKWCLITLGLLALLGLIMGPTP